MAETRGIEETKDILEFMFSFVEAVGKARKDGEMSWSDARYFIDPVTNLFEAVEDIDEVLPEIEDLSEEELCINGCEWIEGSVNCEDINTEFSCNNNDCDWIEDVESGNCSNYNNSS